MASYLQRYLDGEHEAVWAELTALGLAIRAEPLFSDAQAVARETMSRARANIETLAARLNALGYHFVSEALGDERPPYVPPTTEALDALRAIEAEYGALPLAIEAFYEVVGAVDFTGSYPRLSSYTEVDPTNMLMSFQGMPVRLSLFPEPHILGPASAEDIQPDQDPTSDPLVIWPCIEALVDEAPDDGGESDEPAYSLCIAPDALHKANISGGDGPHIAFGAAGMDAPLAGDDWAGVTFVSYLRTAFAWGGFPGLRHERHPPLDLLATLTEGLTPL